MAEKRITHDCVIDGFDTRVVFTKHSLDRNDDRQMALKDVLESLHTAGAPILKGKFRELLVVRDFDRRIAYSYQIMFFDVRIVIRIITVYPSALSFRQANDQRVIVVKNAKSEQIIGFEEYRQALREGRY